MAGSTETECGKEAPEQKAIYAAIAILEACHELEQAMGELGKQNPTSQVLDLLTPVSVAALEIRSTFGGENGPVRAAMYQTGDLVQL